MKTTLPSLQRLFSAAGFAGKLCLPALAVMLYFSNSVVAATNGAHKSNNTFIAHSYPGPKGHSGNAVLNAAAGSHAAGIFSAAINSINIVTPSPTNAVSVQYTVTFSSAVSGVSTGNFSLTAGGVTGASVSSVSGSGSVYTVTVNTGTGDGTIGLNLANSTGISPAISTALPFSGHTYTIDKTAPLVGTLYNYSSNTKIGFAVVGDVITLIFGTNEAIQTPATVTIGGHSVTPVSTGVNLYQASYAMASTDPDGRVHFTVQFTDLAGNTSVLYNDLAAGDDIEFSREAPSASDVSFISNNADNSMAIIGNKVVLSFTASKAIQPPVITIAGHTVAVSNTSGNSYAASYTMTAADPSGNIAFDATLTDASNVTTEITNVSSGKNVLYNNTPTLSLTGNLLALSTVPGVPSAVEEFKVSGFNLSAGIAVEPPTGFELSLDNVTFSRNVTTGSGGVVPPTTVYIRLAATDLSGTYASNVLASSPGASELSLAAASSTVAVQLASLALSSGTLAPAFNGATGAYTANVLGAVSSITVTARNADGVAPITVDGVAVVSNAPSQSLPLNLGLNTVTVLVTSFDNTLTKTYTITVTRVPSTNTNLSNLKINNGAIALTPAFNYMVTGYTASVANATASVRVTAATADANATVKINGTTVTSGTASAAIPLNVGVNVITTVVTAQDGIATKTYAITITRAPSSNAGLAGLALSSGTLSPVFATSTTSYSATVGATSITVTPTTADAGATVKVNGHTVASGMASVSLPLTIGPNIITTVVTAQDAATTETYVVTITRLSNNANLSNLKINSGAIALSPMFNYMVTAYTANVNGGITTIKVTPATSDANATVKINGITVLSGTASPVLPLNVGANIITTVVTAADGITTKTYTITVTRAISTIATLSNLHLSSGTLTPAFASATTAYTATVTNMTTTVTITPTASDGNATIKVNGTAVTSGAASASLPLSLGPNTITTIVTAQDGTTTQTYTVVVTRALSANANLANLRINSGSIALTPAFNYNTTSYTATVTSATATIRLTPATSDANAIVKINGTTVLSGTASGAIALMTGPNTVTTIVRAQDGITTKTYTVTVTRSAGPVANPYEAISVSQPIESPQREDDGIVVHQGVSPNSDGANDFLVIDGISNYPENKLLIANRNGILVYEAIGYNNGQRVFDGHSNKNGKMQPPGTYFYSLAYKVNGIVKYNTGFIVLKY